MSQIKNAGLDQYGTGPFEQQQFGTAGVEGVNDLADSLGILNHLRVVNASMIAGGRRVAGLLGSVPVDDRHQPG